MKGLLLAIFAVSAIGCSVRKDVEVEVANVRLARIDTVYRYPQMLKMLTWKDNKNTEFVSMVPLNNRLVIGTSMSVLRQR